MDSLDSFQTNLYQGRTKADFFYRILWLSLHLISLLVRTILNKFDFKFELRKR